MSAGPVLTQMRSGRRRSVLDDVLDWQILALGLPTPEKEYYWDEDTDYHSDRAWPERGLLFEYEGGVTPFRDKKTGELRQGRHNTILGYEGDCRKYNLASLLGWRIVRGTRRMVDSGEAAALLERAYNAPVFYVPPRPTRPQRPIHKTKPAPKPVRAIRHAKPIQAASTVKGAAKKVS